MVAAAVLAAGAGRASAQAQAPGTSAGRQPLAIRVTAEDVRLNNYLNDLAAPTTFIKVIGGGLFEQLRSDDGGALAHDMASRAGQAAVQMSVRHGLAALMDRSTDYQPCECRGFGPRVQHALLETFTDRRADGSRALSVPRLAGAYAGSFAQLAWERDRNATDVAMNTTLSLGFSALFNIARELTGVAR